MTKVYSTANWSDMIAAIHSGEIVRVTSDVFDYFLGVLPPVFMNKDVYLPNGSCVRASFGFAEGYEKVIAFWCKDGDRYYCCQLEMTNPHA